MGLLHKWGIHESPITRWFLRETPIIMDDLQVALFQETPMSSICFLRTLALYFFQRECRDVNRPTKNSLMDPAYHSVRLVQWQYHGQSLVAHRTKILLLVMSMSQKKQQTTGFVSTCTRLGMILRQGDLHCI